MHPDFWLRRYGLAVLFTALAVGLRTIMDPVLLDHPASMLFVLAVLASSYFGGLGPSLLSGLLSGLAVIYLWIEPRYGLGMTASEWVHLLLLLVAAVAISMVTETLRRARRQAGVESQHALEAQEQLRQSEARFAGFMEHLPGAAWIQHLDGRFIYINSHGLEVMGAKPDEIYGRRLVEIVGPKPIARKLEEMDQRVVSQGVTLRSIETAEDDCYWMISKFPIPNGEGKPALLAGLAFDVTDRERAVGALHAESAFRRAIEAALPAGIAAVDSNGVQSYANPGFCKMVGWDAEELVGQKTPFVYWPEEEREKIEKLFHSMVVNGKSVNADEMRFCRRDGSRFDVLVLVAPLQREDGHHDGWVASITDITAQKRAEAQLKTFTETLEQRVAERTAMAEQRTRQLRLLNAELVETERRERRQLAQMLHDHLQQLLVGAKMQIGAAGRRVKEEDVNRTVRHAEELIGQAITASRTLTFELRPPMLEHGLIPALQWLARSMREKYHLEVALTLDGEAEPYSENVRFLLFESVRELLFNVTKHAGVDEARAALHKIDDTTIRIEVDDRGCGFDVDKLHETSASHLGLLHIMERIDALGGTLSIDSAPGKGTRVALSAPRGEEESKTIPETLVASRMPTTSTHRQSIMQAAARSSRRRTRVLLVDDHTMVREGLYSVLCGHRDIEVVGEAADGMQAVELARALEPDVVVMDVSMPGMDGVDATRHITRERPRCRVIGLSMHEPHHMAQQMRQAGASDYLAKGGPADDLLAAIRGAKRPNNAGK